MGVWLTNYKGETARFRNTDLKGMARFMAKTAKIKVRQPEDASLL